MPNFSFVKRSLLVCLLVSGIAAGASAQQKPAPAKKPAAKPATTTKPAASKPSASKDSTAATTAAASTGAISTTIAPGTLPTVLIDKFFKLYEKEGSGKAIKYIFKTNKSIDSTKLVDLISKVDNIRASYGLYTGKELIVQKKASNSLVLYSYLVKHELDFLRFTFVFYKPKNDWILYRLNFDGSVADELESAAKLGK